MKIGIVGTGNMGRSLGLAWAEQGHEVFFGARDPAKGQAASALAAGAARSGTNQAAAAFGEVVYFNPRDVAPGTVLDDLAALDGKVVIESNNGPIPDDFAYPPITVSRSERLQEQLPRARVVKGFNTMPQEVFEADPAALRERNVACFIAGDDPEARATVATLAAGLGFAPIDCGPLRQARLLEGAGDLIRMIIGTRGEMGLTFAIPTVPLPAAPRFGGREASKLP